jgi:hypothetical protein
LRIQICAWCLPKKNPFDCIVGDFKVDQDISRKHGKKEPQSFVHCSSFDHPVLHSLNDYKFVIFGLLIEFLRIWGLLIYRWKGLENTFSTVYYMPPKL